MTSRTTVLLLLILAFAFFTRVWRLHVPERYIFDEVYHAATAKLIAHNDPRAYEWWHPAPEPDTAIDWLHPPLAKYTQAAGILIFGENSFGWRISSALFGVGVIYLTYLLARKLFTEEVGLVAAFIASLDGLLLTQSRIAMNDIHVTFFILLTLIVYLHYREQEIKTQLVKKSVSIHPKTAARWLFLTGLTAGLAMGSKWSGVFTLGIIGFWELAHLLPDWITSITTQQLLKLVRLGLFIGILPFVVYVASYAHMFIQGKSLICDRQEALPNRCYYEVIKWGDKVLYQGYISHFSLLHRQIWHYQTTLEATHSYQSRPWQWFVNWRPVWFHVAYETETIANVYAFGNPALFWLGDLTVLISVMTLAALLTSLDLRTMKLKIKNPEVVSLAFITLSYFMVWLPWQLSPRIMFFYHYTPAVPLLSIILGYWLTRLKTLHGKDNDTGKLLFTLPLLVIVLCFIVWYPNWAAISVPKEFADTVYFGLKNWK